MKKKSARHVPTVKILKITTFFVFILAYFFLSLYFKLFIIGTITCSTDDGSCSEPVVAEFNHLQGRFFFSPTIYSTVNKVIHSDPYISQIQIKRQFPHAISFFLKKKQPLAEIHCENTDLLVNTDGKIEENTRNLHLDIARVGAAQPLCEQFINRGSVDMNAVRDLMGFSQKIATSNSDLIVQWADEATVLVQTPTHQRIVLPLNQLDRSFQLYQYLLDQNQLQNGWTELDLRFQKAIVKTQ